MPGLMFVCSGLECCGGAELPPGIDWKVDDPPDSGWGKGWKCHFYSHWWLWLPRWNQCTESPGLFQHCRFAESTLLVGRLSQWSSSPVTHWHQSAWSIQYSYWVPDYHNLLLWICQPHVAKVCPFILHFLFLWTASTASFVPWTRLDFVDIFPNLLLKNFHSWNPAHICTGTWMQSSLSTKSFSTYSRQSSTTKDHHSMIKYWRRMNRCMLFLPSPCLSAPTQSLLRKMSTTNCGKSMLRRCCACSAVMKLCLMSCSLTPAQSSSLHPHPTMMNPLSTSIRFVVCADL